MPSDRFAKQMEAYVLGLLDDAQTRAVGEHLRTCADCRRQAAALQSAARLIERGFDQAPPAYLRSKVMANLKDRRAPRRQWLGWAVPGFVAAALVVLVIRIDPGRLAKEQAASPMASRPAETQSLPAPQAGYSPEARKAVTLPVAAKMSEKKKQVPADFASAALGAAAKDDLAPGAPRRQPASRERAEVMEADEEKLEAAAEARDEAPAPAKRAAAGMDLGGRAAAPAVFGAGALSRSESLAAPQSRAQDAGTAAAARPSACAATLAGTEGGSAPAQAQSELDRFADRVRARVLAQGEPRTVMLRVVLDARGQASAAGFAGRAFDSAELNAFVAAQARTLRFTRVGGAPTVVLLVKLEVQ